MDVVPLDICGIVLGIPYLYNRKAVFFRHEKKYHLTKYGVEYIVRYYGMKDISSFVTTGSMKRVVNSNNNRVLTIVEEKDTNKSNDDLDHCYPNEVIEMGQASQWGGKKQKYFNISEEKISPSLASTFANI